MRSKIIIRQFTQQLFVLSALIASTLAAGCASTRVTTGAFPEVNRLETELKRGVSTKADAQKLLGLPAGTGSAVLPTDPKPREVWSYPDIEATAALPRPDRRGIGRFIFVRHQLLLLFFDRETFDGYLWYSNVQEGEGRGQTGGLGIRGLLGRIEYGWPPRTDPIETLRVGASSIGDVLLALGQPRGNGVVRFPVDPTPRQIWSYEQTRIDEEWRIHLKILLVFLRDERYDGHIWFSSLQPPGEKR